MHPELSFRPIEDADEEFLFRLYASTRAEELSVVPWSEEEKTRFLQMQFAAQHKHYQEHFSDAQFSIVLMGGEAVGRLYVHSRSEEIRVVDIAFLPQHRGQGLGARLMGDVLREGQQANKPVRIHVEKNNPALRLYHRLGFKEIGDTGVYFLMEWCPS